MELRHLRYFLAVAGHLHFGRAAAELGIQQPPLSQQIRALESEIGVDLFDRGSRRVRLTPAGIAFRPDAERALAHAAAAVRAAQRAGRGETGTLAVGFVGSATFTLLPRLLRAVRDRHPDVTLNLRELTTTQQVDGLRDGTLDVGLLRPPLPAADTGFLHVEAVGNERLVVALPADHPRAGDRVVDARQLADEPFVLSPRHLGPGLRDQIVDYCRRAGFTPTVAQEAIQMQTIIGLVAGGLGVSLVPASVSQLRRNDVAFRPARPATHVIELAVAYRRIESNPATANLVALARDLARSAPVRPRRPASH
ncbi:LysR family transcriptional regulator [Plantactinospora solaniradicis]|uniref:LysR family transcriptional regulator n=1 Tax=Plantactinospora solaniradicis TaxID=1723736 RepID=A0ABW1KL65_9ACTN